MQGIFIRRKLYKTIRIPISNKFHRILGWKDVKDTRQLIHKGGKP